MTERNEGFIGSDPVTPVEEENRMEDKRKIKMYFFLVVHLRKIDALV